MQEAYRPGRAFGCNSCSAVASIRRLQLRRELRSESLKVVELVEDRIEEDKVGPTGDHPREPVETLRPVAPDGRLLGQLGPAVEGAEPLGEPPPGPRAVAIDRDVDALADRKARGIASGLGEEPAQRLHLFGELRGGD